MTGDNDKDGGVKGCVNRDVRARYDFIVWRSVIRCRSVTSIHKYGTLTSHNSTPLLMIIESIELTLEIAFLSFGLSLNSLGNSSASLLSLLRMEAEELALRDPKTHQFGYSEFLRRRRAEMKCGREEVISQPHLKVRLNIKNY